jgi:hypothetical protein
MDWASGKDALKDRTVDDGTGPFGTEFGPVVPGMLANAIPRWMLIAAN